PVKGLYYPPTLLTNVHPSSTVAQEEIFGPVLAAMTFRTLREAVELANNTTYGLAASVWSENINVALHLASQIKAGVVWVNSTNLFDAACGFGGFRESGYGREGGREGLLEYLEPLWFKKAPALAKSSATKAAEVAEQEKAKAHNRAQVLYYAGENLSQRSDEIGARLARAVGQTQAAREVTQSTERLFSYAAWADKFDGTVHNPPFRNVSMAMNEPIGTI